MEYSRMIAYIYSYNDGLKGKNTGFAKMEVRQGMLKLQINMKCAFADVGPEWEVNLFFRKNGRILPVPIGCMVIRNGMGEFRYATAADDVGMSGIDFADIKGLYVSCSDSRKIFASEWDDLGFSPELIGEIAASKENVVVEYEEPQIVEAPQITVTKPTSAIEKLIDEGDRLFLFSDDELYDCVEIEPRDIERLNDCNWGLMNNSFVNHGYYNYRHLIIGRMNTSEESGYFIGIPGIFTRRERNTAAMFGFNRFKFSMRSDMMLDQFGYWYRKIEG